MSEPFVIKAPQVFIGYSHLGSCQEFVWEAGKEPEDVSQPSRFQINGLNCVSDLEGLMLRDDLYLHTPDNREYLIGNFMIVDVASQDEIRGMASSCRLLTEDFPEAKVACPGEKVTISKATHLHAFRAVSALIGKAHSKMEIDARAAHEVINEMANDMIQTPNAVLNLIAIKSVDDYTFSHNINVATLSLLIGHGMGLSHEDLHDLGTGALLHDLGNLRVSRHLLNKEEPLTKHEFLQITKHPVLGIELLKNSPDISPKARQVIFQHHEKFGGNGYPFGNSGEKIPLLARICAVADVFDAMTTDRPYRPALAPHQAIRNMISQVGTHFDPAVLAVFLKKVSLYPPGSIVELSDGSRAVVIRSNPESIMGPVVRVITEKKDKPQIIDLAFDRSKFIRSPEITAPEKPAKSQIQ